LYNTPFSWFDRFCGRTGMRKVSINSFRHLNTSLLISNNVDVRTVSAALGHSQTSTTLNIYAHAFAQAQARATEAIANALPLNQRHA
jgi:integrase